MGDGCLSLTRVVWVYLLGTDMLGTVLSAYLPSFFSSATPLGSFSHHPHFTGEEPALRQRFLLRISWQRKEPGFTLGLFVIICMLDSLSPPPEPSPQCLSCPATPEPLPPPLSDPPRAPLGTSIQVFFFSGTFHVNISPGNTQHLQTELEMVGSQLYWVKK